VSAWPLAEVRLRLTLDARAANVAGAQTRNGPNVPQPLTSVASPTLDFQFDAVQVGIAEYSEGPTGATVLYFPSKVIAAVDVRGGSPGNSNTDTLRFGYDTPAVDAIVFCWWLGVRS
jgi:hypothetical protein